MKRKRTASGILDHNVRAKFNQLFLLSAYQHLWELVLTDYTTVSQVSYHLLYFEEVIAYLLSYLW